MGNINMHKYASNKTSQKLMIFISINHTRNRLLTCFRGVDEIELIFDFEKKNFFFKA